ncbi:MAG: hypothetical protein KY462_11000 [Actinobacteria bacterium]|nr:hypothetical protein [Actinomycetota bacterium]
MDPRGDGLERLKDWLYVMIVGALTLYFVIGLVAWVWMIAAGVSAPAAFTTILATVAGGLVGIVGPLRAPTAGGGGDRSGATAER